MRTQISRNQGAAAAAKPAQNRKSDRQRSDTAVVSTAAPSSATSGSARYLVAAAQPAQSPATISHPGAGARRQRSKAYHAAVANIASRGST